MATVIKVNNSDAGLRGVVYQFAEMSADTERRPESCREQGDAIIVEAQKEAERIKEQARDAGRREGVEELRSELAAQQEQKLSTLMPALRGVIEDIQHTKQAWLNHWEKNAVHLAVEIAGRLIRRELPKIPELTLSLVREALELAAGSGRIRLHLNPEDYKTIGPQAEEIAKELSGLATAELVADERVSAGGCRLETKFGAIDQQFEAQLARIEEELT